MPAPVAVFAFNRPHHLHQTLTTLAQNEGAETTTVTIYCDGPRHEQDHSNIEAVRAIAHGGNGFAQVQVVEREANCGLARSIIMGVTEQLRQHEQVIVVEDDLVTSPFFLRYMNQALEVYAECDRVISIHGYIYPIDTPLPETFFLRGADCWGWATWRRGWALFNPDGQALLTELERQQLLLAFDLEGAYPFSQMLRDQIAGRNNSWAIRWHASAFLADRLTLYPGRSLVHNIGHDDSGTHSQRTGTYDVVVSPTPIRVEAIAPVPCAAARAAVKQYLGLGQCCPSPVTRVLSQVKKLFYSAPF
ncbi:hypothetical protein [Nodosilinea sp. E11]|uniref:hypothetical protein n=1 Tax=Nodosilinea sp. E11 TaxID=3037479 RepID=UPI002934614B|nr:hypothetical protein [Nodosilinea sp. E11]WOD40832.1 hypothetical protein RRF56_08495 [Nodosilinea sp. E11]